MGVKNPVAVAGAIHSRSFLRRETTISVPVLGAVRKSVLGTRDTHLEFGYVLFAVYVESGG